MTDHTPRRLQRIASRGVAGPADRRAALRGDLLGGLTAGVLTLVTAVAYSAVAGAPLGPGLSSAAVLSGLIGAALGGLVACWLAPAAPQVFSPRASVAVLVASAAATLAGQFGTSPQGLGLTLGWLAVCLLLAAVLQAGFGLLRLGGVIRMMPHAVTAGFTIGLAIELALAQLPQLLPALGSNGLGGYAPAAVGAVVVAMLALAHRGGWNGWAMPLGLAAGIAASEGLRMTLPQAPVPTLHAVDIAAGPLVSLSLALEALRAGFTMPALSTVLGLAFVIAFVNSVETLTSSLAVEDATQRRLDANRALVAAAAGSLAAVCAGGLPVAGSAATSLSAMNAGARSRRSMVVAGLCVAALAALTHRWIDFIPLAAVAALMLSVALTLARAPWNELALLVHEARDPRRAWGEVLLALFVCALLVGVGPVAALVGGVVAGGAVAAAQMRGELVRRRYDATHPSAAAQLASPLPDVLARRIEIIEIGQPLLFATVESAVQVIEAADARAEVIVLDLTLAGAVDASALRTLARSGEALAAAGRRLVLVGTALARPLDRLREDYAVFDALDEALEHAAALLRQSSASARVATALATYAGSRGRLTAAPPASGRDVAAEGDDDAAPAFDVGARSPAPAPGGAADNTFSDAVIQRAVQELAPYVGPVAYALVSQARQAAQSRSELYRLLAKRHLRRAADRHAFLAAADISGADDETATR